MGIFERFFKKPLPKNPEDEYIVTITEEYIRVEHPRIQPEQISWNNINTIKLLNTDEGPWNPDIWLILSGNNQECIIPHGAKGFDEIFDIISKYENFNFDNFGKSMTTTENAEFMLWTRRAN